MVERQTAGPHPEKAGDPAPPLVSPADLPGAPRPADPAVELAAVQRALVQAERRNAELSAMVAQAPVLVLVTRGPQHVVDTLNQRFQDALDRNVEAGVRLAPELPADRRAVLDRAFMHGDTVRLEGASHVLLDVADSGRRFDLIAQPLRDADGAIIGVVVVAADVTAEVQAREALVAHNRLATLMASVGLGLTRAGSQRDMLQACTEALVAHAGAAFARIWRLDPDEDVLVLEASAGQYTHLNGPHGRVPVGRYKIGQIALDRQPHLTNDVAHDPRIGDPAWAAREGMVAFAGYPLLLGSELIGVLAMFSRDTLSEVDLQALGAIADLISIGIARKRQEAALVASEAALRRRAAELTAAARGLERANRELDAFAYAASHDLRAPLRGIANLSQWIEEDLGDHLTDEARNLLGLMRSRVNRMESLVEGLLQYSRAGRVRQATAVVDTAALAREVVDLLAPPPEVSVTIADDMPVIVTERLPLHQVFLNLIANALKHARRPDVHVDVSARRVEGGYAFTVGDNGVGIAPEYHDRIWGIFQTLEARDTVEGTGIGLSLVKKLVEAQGGQVGIRSAPGEGAAFTVTWPVAADAVAAGADTQGPEPRPTSDGEEKS